MPRSSATRVAWIAFAAAWLSAHCLCEPLLAADDESAYLADWSLLELPPVTPLSASLVADQPLPAAAPLNQSLIVDPNVSPASFEHHPGSGYETGSGSAWGQPINWTAGPYLKSGVVLALGDGMLEGDQSPGYTISGGMRQPLAAGIAGDNVFVDLGGSYLSAFGQTVRTTTGNVTITGQSTIIGTTDNAFRSTLTELQRSTVHTALGYYWGSPVDERNGGWDVRLATRFGGRVGSMRGVFDEVRLVVPAAGTTLSPSHAKTDLSGGLFLGVEAILLRQASRYGTFQWTLDGEFANDWVSFEGFKTSSNLGTASIMLGFMLSR